MRSLKIKAMGDNVQGVTLRGLRSHPEPEAFRVSFPCGDVEVTRATDEDDPEWWVHVRVNRPGAGLHVPGETHLGRVVSARIDSHGRHAGEVPSEVLADPHLYHLAVRVAPDADARAAL